MKLPLLIGFCCANPHRHVFTAQFKTLGPYLDYQVLRVDCRANMSEKKYIGGGSSASFSEVCCEIFNHGPEKIIFDNNHPNKVNQPFEWARIICEPQKRVFLPHQMYIQRTPSGGPIRTTKFFGDDMESPPIIGKEKH